MIKKLQSPILNLLESWILLEPEPQIIRLKKN